MRHEVEPASLGGDRAIIAPHPCMRWDPVGSRTMMQLYASVAKLRSSGSPFFSPAWKPLGGCERPLPRIVHGGSSLKSAGTPKLAAFISPIGWDCTISYAAGLSLKPPGTTPVLTYRQSAMINLRASATIIGLRAP